MPAGLRAKALLLGGVGLKGTTMHIINPQRAKPRRALHQLPSGLYVDMRIDMRIGMCIGMRIDKCVTCAVRVRQQYCHRAAIAQCLYGYCALSVRRRTTTVP